MHQCRQSSLKPTVPGEGRAGGRGCGSVTRTKNAGAANHVFVADSFQRYPGTPFLAFPPSPGIPSIRKGRKLMAEGQGPGPAAHGWGAGCKSLIEDLAFFWGFLWPCSPIFLEAVSRLSESCASRSFPSCVPGRASDNLRKCRKPPQPFPFQLQLSREGWGLCFPTPRALPGEKLWRVAANGDLHKVQCLLAANADPERPGGGGGLLGSAGVVSPALLRPASTSFDQLRRRV